MLNGQVALVTGASRGIGEAVALELARAGAVVVGTSTSEEGAARVTKALAEAGGKGAGRVLDVRDAAACAALADAVAAEFGPVAILVNNAGAYPEPREARVTDTKTSVWRETVETNLFGAVRMCREVVPLMQRVAYGRVVNMSSGLGQLSKMGEGSPAYRVSKAALNALTVTLAAEVKGQGILVNSMSPGWVRTDMGGEEAPRGVDEGADTAVWLALLPSSGPTGQFFRDRKPIPW